MIDLMNNCGCYHVFIPVKDRVERTIQRYYYSDPFAPQWLPEIAAGQFPAVRILSGWHQVQRLLRYHTSAGWQSPMSLLPYETLESLPWRMGGSSSVFDAQGIAKGSERIERFDLLPHWHPFHREHAAARAIMPSRFRSKPILMSLGCSSITSCLGEDETNASSSIAFALLVPAVPWTAVPRRVRTGSGSSRSPDRIEDTYGKLQSYACDIEGIYFSSGRGISSATSSNSTFSKPDLFRIEFEPPIQRGDYLLHRRGRRNSPHGPSPPSLPSFTVFPWTILFSNPRPARS